MQNRAFFEIADPAWLLSLLQHHVNLKGRKGASAKWQ
jgi:hypothetical protein